MVCLGTHQVTWVCAQTPVEKTTFLLEWAFLHFHASWWEGMCFFFFFCPPPPPVSFWEVQQITIPHSDLSGERVCL